MRIAIVGYGSLIWDLEILSAHVIGEWQMAIGPAMPVEFSRISPKRKKALVLVIDENLNHQCTTSVIESRRSSVEHAVDDLAKRERCAVNMIGYVSSCGKNHRPLGCADKWLEQSEFDAVLWTALPGNFKAEHNLPFNHKNGREYLESLETEALEEAWKYIEFAPEETDTPFRRYLRNDPFWMSLDFSRDRP